MIHYQLRCRSAHEFEGWFRSSAAFEQQEAGGLLSCPFCGTTEVGRAMMAPAIRSGRAVAPASSPDAAEATTLETGTAATMPQPPTLRAASPAAMPDALRAALQRMRAAVERNCEDMGDRFAAEAIRMHHGDVEERGIYGSTTERDRDALEDAGVEVVAIPWLRSADG